MNLTLEVEVEVETKEAIEAIEVDIKAKVVIKEFKESPKLHRRIVKLLIEEEVTKEALVEEEVQVEAIHIL